MWSNDHSTSTAVLLKLWKPSCKSTVSMEALGRAAREEEPPVDSGGAAAAILSQERSHLACMYRCFLHGPICILFSFMLFFAAEHRILIRLCSLSTFPTKTSGIPPMSCLYSSLALATSNSARKFNSIITLISAFFELELTTSRKVCSPDGISGELLHLDLQTALLKPAF